MTNTGWLPHFERLLLFLSVAFVGFTLFHYYKRSDNSLELRFITRDDFRRVEAKLDTVINIAAYIEAKQFIKSKRKKPVDTLDK